MFYIIPSGKNAVLQMLNKRNTLSFFPPAKGLYYMIKNAKYFEESIPGIKEKIQEIQKKRRKKKKIKAM